MLVDLRVGHVEIACALVGLYAHVGHALHVVLSAQWVDAAAGFANIAGDHGQVGNLHHGIGALVVFRNAQAVERHGLWGGSIGDGGGAHLFARHARHRFQIRRG